MRPIARQPDASPEASPEERAALHDAVAEIVRTSCSYSRCHGNLVANAGLVFTSVANFRDVLVDVTSCEYDVMPRVAPGKPRESWMMIKLTSPVYDDPERLGIIVFTPDPSWVQKSGPCANTWTDGTPLFGMRMPATAPNVLPDDQIATIKRWIESGAP